MYFSTYPKNGLRRHAAGGFWSYNTSMIPLFLGLTVANLIILAIVFTLGLTAAGAEDGTSSLYTYHLAFGFTAGLMVLLTHLSVYVYFMATTKWLAAATDKVGFDPQRFSIPAQKAKRRSFVMVMSIITVTMLTMFAGAGADVTITRLWPGELHLALAAVAIAANLFGALAEYQIIRNQGRLMDEAIALVTGDTHASTAS